MATVGFRQGHYPAISDNPTSEELARHLRLIYQALNDHDSAIVTLHSQVNATTTPTNPKAVGSPQQVTPQKTARKFGLP